MSRTSRPQPSVEGGTGFDDIVLPHLDAAYRLARWLVRNHHDAEDVVQEASLRAWRYFGTFTGGNGRAWFLRIVRNTCWVRRKDRASVDLFEEDRHSDSTGRPASDPETLLLRADGATLIGQALSGLPIQFHQLLVLRELEGLSYRELADVTGVPIGTVMSRLSRARVALREAVDCELKVPRPPATSRLREQEVDAVLA
jgi:RNA polymerase sigma-70 factor, ECF subfamily